jgi:hypothetical protein
MHPVIFRQFSYCILSTTSYKVYAMKQPSDQMSTPTFTRAADEAKYLTSPDGLDENEIARQAQQGLPLALP